MAKRINSISLKGILLNDNIVEELGKKDEDPSEFYNLDEILNEFRDKMVSIVIKEEAAVGQAEE